MLFILKLSWMITRLTSESQVNQPHLSLICLSENHLRWSREIITIKIILYTIRIDLSKQRPFLITEGNPHEICIWNAADWQKQVKLRPRKLTKAGVRTWHRTPLHPLTSHRFLLSCVHYWICTLGMEDSPQGAQEPLRLWQNYLLFMGNQTQVKVKFILGIEIVYNILQSQVQTNLIFGYRSSFEGVERRSSNDENCRLLWTNSRVTLSLKRRCCFSP